FNLMISLYLNITCFLLYIESIDHELVLFPLFLCMVLSKSNNIRLYKWSKSYGYNLLINFSIFEMNTFIFHSWNFTIWTWDRYFSKLFLIRFFFFKFFLEYL